MLRAGLEFFAFTPKAGETVQIIFLRFDMQLDRANSLADLGISYPFRSWMLLSLMRMSPKRWSECLKDLGHRFPKTEIEYKNMQNAIVRERTLEIQVCSLSNSIPQEMGIYLPADDAPLASGMPLYVCLGNIAEMGTSNSTYFQFLTENVAGVAGPVTSVFLYELGGIEGPGLPRCCWSCNSSDTNG